MAGRVEAGQDKINRRTERAHDVRRALLCSSCCCFFYSCVIRLDMHELPDAVDLTGYVRTLKAFLGV